jgi:hypothetical protein
LDELGYQYKRTNVNRTYSSVAIVIALERTTMVYRYEVNELSAIVDIWSERPNSGDITYIEIKGKNEKDNKKILKLFSEKLPRKPWEYTIGQKIRNGWFSQGILGAKKSWYKVIE